MWTALLIVGVGCLIRWTVKGMKWIDDRMEWFSKEVGACELCLRSEIPLRLATGVGIALDLSSFIDPKVNESYWRTTWPETRNKIVHELNTKYRYLCHRREDCAGPRR